uniref:Uncharacterized protein n=1 Tax=viral metagenome TaxID=1070528 RepID=A0A6M3M730_9ZZZZ
MNTKERKAEKRKEKRLSFEQTAKEVSSSDRFWCDRNGQFIHTIVCINRQDKGREGCMNCAQGNIVRETFSRLQDTSVEPGSRNIALGNKRKAIQL